MLAFGSSISAWAQQKPETFDRASPRKTMEGFLRASRAGDHVKAANYLDLRSLNRAERAEEGPRIAKQLALVIDWTLVIDPSKLSDATEGDPTDGPDADIIGTVNVDGEAIPIALAHTRLDDGTQGWLVAKTTIATVPSLYASYGARWFGDRMPAALRTRVLDLALWQWAGVVVAVPCAWLLGVLFEGLLTAIGIRLARRTKPTWDDELVRAARGPVRLALGVGIFRLLSSYLHLSAAARVWIDHSSTTLHIVAAAWLVIRVIELGARSIDGNLPEDTVGEMQSRGRRTQLAVMRRVLSIVVGVVAASAILTQFEIVRSFGTSLLASAGIAGVLIGIAAQKTLGTIIGGIHLSITQPLRIGDTVVIEGEFGVVEEISLSYVVLKLWDERRLIIPVGRLLEQAFQNWTRTSSDIIGAVLIHADYTTDVNEIRAELDRIVKGHPAWDGRVCKLQVTDATDRSMTLRAVVSARTADKCFELRCDVREKLIAFLQQKKGGAHLPRLRMSGLGGPMGQVSD